MPAVKPTQDGRPGILTTPLGKDVLLLERFDSAEGLSELFEFRIDALSTQADLNFDTAIGKPCTVKITTFKKEEREFTGILTEAQWLGARQQFYTYRLVLRPWFWLLSHTNDYRIFEKMKAPDIIEQVLGERSLGKFQMKVQDRGSFPVLDYCVQYRETDFNFLSRLMEKEGIYYFFEHSGEDHTLVMVNEKASLSPVPKHATIPLRPSMGSFVPQEQRIEDWTAGRRFRTGKFALNDYNYEKPNTQMLGKAQATAKYEHGDLEIYNYPGVYKEPSVGERYAKIVLEAEQAVDNRRQASGEAISLFPGGLTTLTDHPTASQNIEYLIVRAMHSLIDQSYRSGTGNSGTRLSSQFEFQPSAQPFRAPLTTPKPRIYGIQTAKVVTKDEGGGEEIDVEQLSEIYVRFYWDRKQHKTKRSCKIRVAQVWSGKKWGGQFIPRVGMEAVVEFLEGDPDQPLCTGCVYNDEYKPPYDLPGKKNIAGIKSDSTKGSGGYNELNFDDTKNSEKITFHAEKDHSKTVKHAETTEIGETFEVPLGSPSREVTVKKGDDKLTVKSGDHNLEVSSGNQKIKIALTQKTDVGVQIEIICGESKITMNPAQIKLEAMMIELDAQVLLKLHGTMVQLQGDAMTQVSGGIVMIG